MQDHVEKGQLPIACHESYISASQFPRSGASRTSPARRGASKGRLCRPRPSLTEEKAGQRQAKTGSKNRKFEGEGATSKEIRVDKAFRGAMGRRWKAHHLGAWRAQLWSLQEEKKKKNNENVKKRALPA